MHILGTLCELSAFNKEMKGRRRTDAAHRGRVGGGDIGVDLIKTYPKCVQNSPKMYKLYMYHIKYNQKICKTVLNEIIFH